MRFAIYACAGSAALILAACAPTFNWRETPISATSLSALFPCKPLKASRRLELGGAQVELQMTACDAGGVTFAVGHASVPDLAMTGQALAQWRQATLAGMHATTSSATALRLAGATEVPQAVRVQAVGSGPDGRELALQAAWFTRDNEIFGALLYGKVLDNEATDAFFAGLKFR